MKFKYAVAKNVLTGYQISLIEDALGKALPEIICKNFPDWEERFKSGKIHAGEIILQDTDTTKPILGLNPGIHLTMSLMSFKLGRDFDGLANDAKSIIKAVKDEKGRPFMADIEIFIQMTLDTPVVKTGTNSFYTASGSGISLLDF